LSLGAQSQDAVPGVVRSYEYFGHDAVVRVEPDGASGLPELVIRISGGEPWSPGSPVGLRVNGALVTWPGEDKPTLEAE